MIERERKKTRVYRNESDLDENSFEGSGSLLSICFLATLHYHAVESEYIHKSFLFLHSASFLDSRLIGSTFTYLYSQDNPIYSRCFRNSRACSRIRRRSFANRWSISIQPTRNTHLTTAHYYLLREISAPESYQHFRWFCVYKHSTIFDDLENHSCEISCNWLELLEIYFSFAIIRSDRGKLDGEMIERSDEWIEDR